MGALQLHVDDDIVLVLDGKPVILIPAFDGAEDPALRRIGGLIRRDMNCSVDLRSTAAVRDRRYSRMRRDFCSYV